MNCFKAYDIRGRVPDELNEDLARRIGLAYASLLQPQKVVIGRDVRLSSLPLSRALAQGLCEGGADVYDLGLCGTEEVYHATYAQEMDGGIMVTASHNPVDFNGMKLVREGARPISGDSGLNRIRELAQSPLKPKGRRGRILPLGARSDYVDTVLGFVDAAAQRPCTVVVNAGNGCAGPVLDALAEKLPHRFVRIHHEPDGSFPEGIPNPLLPENRRVTADAVCEAQADLGVAWDGDFDRCFLFDETGTFIEGYYVVGLLAEAFLRDSQGERVVHDPRLTWNTVDVVTRGGGIPVMSKTGHAFIKERMREEDAIYGGEMSAHHYFRDFAYCDSGMIPWLLVLELMSRSGLPLSELVSARMRLYPVSGEINRHHPAPQQAMKAVEERFGGAALHLDRTDGLSMEFADWRFNLRLSNTEAVLRLNVEARGDRLFMEGRTEEILTLVDDLGGGQAP